MNEQISWIAELQVKPGQLEAFRALTEEMIESTRGEPGALIYERFIGESGEKVYVVERYADSPAAIEHLALFGEEYGKRFVTMVERKSFIVFGSPSVELKQLLDGFSAEYLTSFAGFSRF